MFSLKKLTIRGKILLFMLLLLLVPASVIGIMVTSRVAILSNQNADDSANALLDEEKSQLNRTAVDEAQRINEIFSQVVDEVTILDAYTEALFNNEMNVTPYLSYWWDADLEFQETGREIPGRNPATYNADYDSYDISFDVSCIYMPRDKVPGGDPFSWPTDLGYFINVSSSMDYMFRNLHEANPNYIWIYAAFKNDYSLFRNYPYDSMEWTQYDEDFVVHLPPEQDWDPIEEDFYTGVINAAQGTTVFTAPYYDPTGLLISAGQSVEFSNGTTFGVVSVDISIETMNQNILNIDVLDDGYAFLIDSNGDTISHPDLVDELVPISTLEIGGTSSAFDTIVSSMKSGENAIKTYIKTNETTGEEETWYIAYAPVSTTGYSLAVVVPESNVILPANEIREDIQKVTRNQIVLLVTVLLIAILFIIVMAMVTSNRIVRPIKDVTGMANLIASGDLSRDFKQQREMPRELAVFHATFDNLLTSLRFGNQDYYRGDLQRAFNNYLKSLELFRTTNNQRGIALTLNNLANVHRARKEFDKAEQLYLEAIEIGKGMNDYFGLASRYNNLGLLMLDNGQYQLAQNHIQLALQYDEKSDNQRGKIVHLNNLGLIHQKMGEGKLAYRFYTDALEIAEKMEYARGIAMSKLNIGIYYVATRDFETAETYLIESLALGKEIKDLRVVAQSLESLSTLYRETSNIKEANKYEGMSAELNKISRDKKLVMFVMDYSGSMSGRRIEAAVQGALTLFEQQINPQDEVGIILFSSDSQIVLNLTSVEGNEKNIQREFKKMKNPYGATSFYDALGDAFSILASIRSNEQRWIIALTDGEDNSSRSFNITQRKPGIIGQLLGQRDKSIQGLIQDSMLNVNLIVIGVGSDLSGVEYGMQRLCQESPRGKYLAIRDSGRASRAIEQAFEQVRDMLAQVDVEGVDFDDEY